MRRCLAAGVASLTAFMVAAAPVGALGVVGTLVPVQVGPSSPSPTTTVTVSFRLPAATTPGGPVIGPVSSDEAMTRSDEIDVVGRSGRAQCLHAGEARVPVAAAGTMVHVALSPAALGGSWCTGRFTGEVVQTEEPNCAATAHRACPMYMLLPQIIGRFHFTVASR
jgi:hypothetical protein